MVPRFHSVKLTLFPPFYNVPSHLYTLLASSWPLAYRANPGSKRRTICPTRPIDLSFSPFSIVLSSLAPLLTSPWLPGYRAGPGSKRKTISVHIPSRPTFPQCSINPLSPLSMLPSPLYLPMTSSWLFGYLAGPECNRKTMSLSLNALTLFFLFSFVPSPLYTPLISPWLLGYYAGPGSKQKIISVHVPNRPTFPQRYINPLSPFYIAPSPLYTLLNFS